MINPIVRPIVNAISAAITGGHGSSGGINIADVFNIVLHTGDGQIGRTVTTGFDMTADDGMVWIKRRSTVRGHVLFDTKRGNQNRISSDLSAAEVFDNGVFAFNSSGFTLDTNPFTNTLSETYVSWSFLKTEKFFDVVAYSGDSVSGRTIPHSLAVTPGFVLIKKRTATGSWAVQHISRGGTKGLNLDGNFGEGPILGFWNDTAADATNVTVGNDISVNETGHNYIMYVFANDPAGIIQCGQYIGNGLAAGPSINLGWKPQFLLIKRATGTGSWLLLDTTRGIPAGNDPSLAADALAAEVTTIDYIDLTSTGFDVATADTNVNVSGEPYIFMAIREE